MNFSTKYAFACFLGIWSFSNTAALAETTEASSKDPTACLLRVARVEREGKPQAGLVLENQTFLPLPENLVGKDGLDYLSADFPQKACAWLAKQKQKNLASIHSLKLLPALPQPENVVAVGLNYADHNKEVDKSDLVLFSKRTEFTAANAPIQRPNGSLLDWEVELGVVIRKELKAGDRLTPNNYREYIAGFVITNDVSNRIPIIKDTDKGFSQGKTEPSFLPVGPYFVPSESLPLSSKGIPELPLALQVNGEQKQAAKTTDMSNSFYSLIEKILEQRDEYWTDAAGRTEKLLVQGKLKRGDLILTGTPGGTALQVPALGGKLGLGLRALTQVRNPKTIFIEREYCSGRYLREGDLVEAEIGPLGKQQNRVTEGFAQELPVRCARKSEVQSFLDKDRKQI